jgi:hypothetical protein
MKKRIAAIPNARKNENDPNNKIKTTDISKPSQYRFF